MKHINCDKAIFIAGPALGHRIRIHRFSNLVSDRVGQKIFLTPSTGTTDDTNFKSIDSKDWVNRISTVIKNEKPDFVFLDGNLPRWFHTLPDGYNYIALINSHILFESNSIQKSYFEENLNEINNSRTSHGLTKVYSFHQLVRNFLLMCPDPYIIYKYFQSKDRDLFIKSNYLYPFHNEKIDSHLVSQRQKPNKLLIYLGSTCRPDLYNQIAKCAVKLQQKIGFKQITWLGSGHDSIEAKRVTDDRSEFRIIELTDYSLAIAHGGCGTIYDLLYHDIPTILLPSHDGHATFRDCLLNLSLVFTGCEPHFENSTVFNELLRQFKTSNIFRSGISTNESKHK